MNKQKLAKELCKKDGKDWDELDDAGKHGYEHYADVVMRKEAQPIKEGKAKLGHTHAKPIEPGLTGELPLLKQEEDGLLTEENLQKMAEELPKPAPVKPDSIPEGKYWCTHCLVVHREDKKIGKRHLKYKG